MIATVAILPPALIDRYFYKSISFWAWLFTGLALVLRHFSSFHLHETFGGISEVQVLTRVSTILFYSFGVLNLILWARIRFSKAAVTRTVLIFITVFGLAAVVTDSLLYRPNLNPVWAQNLLIPLHFISASLLLGGFLTGMIFGHWYLVNTDMPKKLLVTMAWVLIATLVFRVIAVVTTLEVTSIFIRPGVDFLENLTALQGHGIFFWQRILVGLAIPAVVVAMIWSTARIGSNQSATGIMYVAVAFVFIGELVARYLFLLSTIPL